MGTGAAATQLDGAAHSAQHARSTVTGVGQGPQVVSTSQAIETLCGPLLNYKRMSNTSTSKARWHGSVLIVTTPGQIDPKLYLRSRNNLQSTNRPPSTLDQFVDAPETPASGLRNPPQAQGSYLGEAGKETLFHGEKLYEDDNVAFWYDQCSTPLSGLSRNSTPNAYIQYQIPRMTMHIQSC